MNSKSGFNLERIVKNHLTDLEFNVEKDSDWEHIHKLDMVIMRFPGMPGIYPMGVQITERMDEHAKLQEFTTINSGDSRVTPKSLYIEVDPAAPMEKGGAQLIAAALFDYQFNTAMADKPVYGLRVNRGLTYEFFDPKQRLQSKAVAVAVNKQTIEPPATPVSVRPAILASAKVNVTPEDVSGLSSALKGLRPRVGGFIHSYFSARGFGMITAQDGTSYFVHVYSVADLALREKLNALPSIEGAQSIEEPVTFVDGGKTKHDAKYPEAKDVRAA